MRDKGVSNKIILSRDDRSQEVALKIDSKAWSFITGGRT